LRGEANVYPSYCRQAPSENESKRTKMTNSTGALTSAGTSGRNPRSSAGE
jgi:hypothetical protein